MKALREELKWTYQMMRAYLTFHMMMEDSHINLLMGLKWQHPGTMILFHKILNRPCL